MVSTRKETFISESVVSRYFEGRSSFNPAKGSIVKASFSPKLMISSCSY